MTLRKVIFTDIDGVLHPAEAARIEWINDEWQAAGQALFCWAPLLWELIAPHAVDLVIHSTWRYSYHLDELRNFFPEAMRERIVGVTNMLGRHESILEYAEQNSLEDYMVLDDMPRDFPEAWAPLVICPSEYGISDERVRQSIQGFLEK